MCFGSKKLRQSECSARQVQLCCVFSVACSVLMLGCKSEHRQLNRLLNNIVGRLLPRRIFICEYNMQIVLHNCVFL